MTYEKVGVLALTDWLKAKTDPGTYNVEIDFSDFVDWAPDDPDALVGEINGSFDFDQGTFTPGAVSKIISTNIQPGVFLNLRIPFPKEMNCSQTLTAIIFGTSPSESITYLKSLEVDMSKTPLLKSFFLVGLINDFTDINLKLAKIDCQGDGIIAPAYMCKGQNINISFKSYENIGNQGELLVGVNDITGNLIFKGPNITEPASIMSMTIDPEKKVTINTLDLSPFKNISGNGVFSPEHPSSSIEVHNIIFGPKTKSGIPEGSFSEMFYGSTALNTVKIPGIVINEGGLNGPLYQAFANCSNLTEVTISKSFVDWAEAHHYDHNAVFSNATSLKTFYITDATEEELPTLKQKIVDANIMLDIPNVEGITVKVAPKPTSDRYIYTFVRIS